MAASNRTYHGATVSMKNKGMDMMIDNEFPPLPVTSAQSSTITVQLTMTETATISTMSTIAGPPTSTTTSLDQSSTSFKISLGNIIGFDSSSASPQSTLSLSSSAAKIPNTNDLSSKTLSLTSVEASITTDAFKTATVTATAITSQELSTLPHLTTLSSITKYRSTGTTADRIVSTPAITILSTSSTGVRSTVVPSYSTSAQETSLTTSETNQNPSQNSKIVPVIATIVPLVFIGMAGILYAWWRKKKILRQKQQDDIENEAVWVNGNGTLYCPGRLDHSGEPIDGKKEQETQLFSTQQMAGAATASRHFAGKPKVIQIPSNASMSSPTNAHPQTNPFLTPTSQSGFGTAISRCSGPETLRASQIGLAVTTPPSMHNRNASTLSLPSSIRTMIHHAAYRLSNPFRDPVSSSLEDDSDDTGRINERSAKSGIQDQKCINAVSSQQSVFKMDQSKQDLDTATNENNLNKGSLPKSNTPPEELARQMIEILKLEAEQAQQAAAEAAQQALKLKNKANINTKSGDHKD